MARIRYEKMSRDFLRQAIWACMDTTPESYGDMIDRLIEACPKKDLAKLVKELMDDDDD